MADQRQIQAGETFLSDSGPYRKVSRQGNIISYYDAQGKQMSSLDISQPGNEAAGFLSSQYYLQGGATPDPIAPTQIEINEVSRLSGVNQDASYGIVRDLQQMSDEDRAISIRRMTANREASPAVQANVIGSDGEALKVTNPLSEDPAYSEKNASFNPPTQEQMADPNFWRKVINPQQFQAYVENFGITEENEPLFLKRDGDDIYIRSDIFDQSTEQKEIAYDDVSVDADGEIPSDLLDSALTNPKTDADIQALINNQQALQQEVLDAFALTGKEIALQEELADLRLQQEELILSAELGIQDISEQPIAMGFIVGQAKNVEQRANLKLRSLAAQEANLLERLNIATNERMINVQAAETALNFNTQNIELAFKIQEQIQAQEDRVLNRTLSLRQDARETLTTILSTFQGLDYNDLDSDAKAKIGQLAQTADIPIDVLIDGMEIVKNQVMQRNIFDEANMKQIVTDDYGNKYVWDSLNDTFTMVNENYEASGSIPNVQEQFTSAMGGGVVTGYGSDKWDMGLDVVFDTPEVTVPFDFEVVKVDDGHVAGEENSFGNQVRVRNLENGQEVWLSHFNSINPQLEVGKTYTKGTTIGIQGNTGSTYSTNGGDGTHVDITMPKADGGFYSPREVAERLGIRGTSSSPQQTALDGVRQKAEFDMKSAITEAQVYGVQTPVSPEFFNKTVDAYISAGYNQEDANQLVSDLFMDNIELWLQENYGYTGPQITKLVANNALLSSREEQARILNTSNAQLSTPTTQTDPTQQTQTDSGNLSLADELGIY